MHRLPPSVSLTLVQWPSRFHSDDILATSNLTTRRSRSETALRQITKLQNSRVQGGGAGTRRLPLRSVPYDAENFSASPADLEAGDTRASTPRFAKVYARPTTTPGSSPPDGQMARSSPRPDGQMARGPPPPNGQMVRSPAAMRITRNAGGERPRGPNLGARSAGRPSGSKGDRGQGGREQGPKKRDRKDGDNATQSNLIADTDPATTLSDGMVQHLLRLQRQEWDRVPYEPKYAMGSFAAQELIHEGRELFRGETPPVKIWGELEKRIGVVGMFGAEAHLKIKRVLDGDAEPFGQETVAQKKRRVKKAFEEWFGARRIRTVKR
jgi:hypothetical protein